MSYKELIQLRKRQYRTKSLVTLYANHLGALGHMLEKQGIHLTDVHRDYSDDMLVYTFETPEDALAYVFWIKW